jgi:hypothetical protein
MRIGIDFDNTIAGYDGVFAPIAVTSGLIDSEQSGLTKREVRDLIKSRCDGETDWIRLQSRVYGRDMHSASLIDGFENFAHRCKRSKTEIFIVSHKTEFGQLDPDRINLRQAAFQWMEAKGFFNPAGINLLRENVFFEDTRQLKIQRIAKLGCTHFIDDLEDVLTEPSFPESAERFLLAGSISRLPEGPFNAFRTWQEVENAIFDAGA